MDMEERIEELDMFVSELMTKVAGSSLPAFAVAIALIDAGVISRGRLLEIVDAIIDFGASHVPAIGENEDYLESAETLRMLLEGTEMSAGSALDQIRILSSAAALRTFFQRRAAKPRRDPPTDGEPGA